MGRAVILDADGFGDASCGLRSLTLVGPDARSTANEEKKREMSDTWPLNLPGMVGKKPHGTGIAPASPTTSDAGGGAKRGTGAGAVIVQGRRRGRSSPRSGQTLDCAGPKPALDHGAVAWWR